MAASDATDGVRVLPVSPSFRIIALAVPPSADEQWMHPETIGMFDTLQMPVLSVDEVCVCVCVCSGRGSHESRARPTMTHATSAARRGK